MAKNGAATVTEKQKKDRYLFWIGVQTKKNMTAFRRFLEKNGAIQQWNITKDPDDFHIEKIAMGQYDFLATIEDGIVKTQTVTPQIIKEAGRFAKAA